MSLKQSNYNINIKYSENENAIYNTLTRNYIIIDKKKRDSVEELLNSLHKEQFSKNEAIILTKLIKNGIIVKSTFDEFSKINYLFNKTKYQENIFSLIISPTLDCNFNCPYCFEERKQIKLNDEIKDKIIKFVKKTARNVRTLNVSWFGGEPTLEYHQIIELLQKIKIICDNEKCKLSGSMTSNGYLLDTKKIDELISFGLKKIQITIDGDKSDHNKSRPLINGHGSFDRVFKNLLEIAERDIMIFLRINVTPENIKNIPILLDKIPKHLRSKLYINMCNIFQNEKKINLSELYKEAIDKGYTYKFIRSHYSVCEGNFVNSITVQPDGTISPCQMCNERGLTFGEFSKEGDMKLTNEAEYYKFRYASPLNNEKCRKCDILPICIGGCTYQRYIDPKKCYNKNFDNMSIEELVSLEIYNDRKNNILNENNIIR